jgi:beta-glucanase (GH16 family)
MQSYKYMFFGRVDITLQAAPGAGVVTSFVLQSDDLDEIDLEWVGGDNARVQSNYFSKGDTTTYDRGAYHAVDNPIGQLHTYSIDWTKDRVQWLINGVVIRTLTYADAKGGASFPQTPMQIKFGTWVAGRKDAPKGTVDWAGGYTNYAEGPFIAYYKSIKITDNAGGVTGAKQYIYSDRTGTWQSIKVDTVNEPPPRSSGTASPSGTQSASPSGSTLKTSTTASGSAPTSGSTTGTGRSSTTSTGTSSQTGTPGSSGAAANVLTLGSLGLAGAALFAVRLFF